MVIAAILLTAGLLRDAAARPSSSQVTRSKQAALTLRTQNLQFSQMRSLSGASLRSITVGF